MAQRAARNWPRPAPLIAVVQPRATAPTPDLDDFDTFYTFDTPATLTSPAPAP
jgi:hypothetical protein